MGSKLDRLLQDAALHLNPSHWRIFVIKRIFSGSSCPLRAIPDSRINWHRLWWISRGYGITVNDFSYGYVVHQKPACFTVNLGKRGGLVAYIHYMVIVPENAVVVETLCWIEPLVKLLFPSCLHASVSVHVGLQHPFPSLLILIMVVRKSIKIW